MNLTARCNFSSKQRIIQIPSLPDLSAPQPHNKPISPTADQSRLHPESINTRSQIRIGLPIDRMTSPIHIFSTRRVLQSQFQCQSQLSLSLSLIQSPN